MTKIRKLVLIVIVLVVIVSTVFELFFWFGTPASALTPADQVMLVGATHIAYTVQGHGPAVLLLHSGAWSSLEYQQLVPQLSEHYTLYLIDMPGFGDSDKPQVRYTVPYLTAELAQFIQQLPVQQFHLVGASVGGTIALNLAAQFPQRVQTLTLIDPIGFGLDINHVALMSTMPVVSEVLFSPNLVSFYYVLNQGLLLDVSLPEQYEKSLFNSAKLPKSGRAKLDLLRSTITFQGINPDLLANVNQVAPQVRQPVLLLWGANDTFAPIVQHQSAQTLIPQAQFVTIQNSGHFPQIEQPTVVSSALANFWQAH